MSAEGGSGRGSGREGTGPAGSVLPQPYPAQFYPVGGYQGMPPHPWYPGHPTSGAPAQWTPSWSPAMGYPAPPTPWSTQQTAASPVTKPTKTTAAMPSDEYTVDTLRRIYNDDDGRVEIQRVKVQRRQPETGAHTFPPAPAPDSMAMVPVSNFPLNERRPPPRKNRRKQQVQMVPSSGSQAPAGPYPWYPCMPYMPYPYPYPYYFGGCMWPPGVPAATPVSSWSGHDDSERASSAQGSLPTTLDSQRLESRASHPTHGSLSPDLHRSPSPAAASHITDIAPSDSISMRGQRRETSLELAFRGPTPPPRTKSRASSSDFKSSDIGKTQEWMIEMHRALGTTVSDVTDKSSLTNTTSDIVIYKKIPPKRTRRKGKLRSISDKDSVADQKDADNLSDVQSVTSDMSIESSRLSSELNYAFRKLEQSVDAFKTKVSVESTPVQSPAPSPSIDIMHSSGEVTPTDADMVESPLPDINIPEQETKTEGTDGHEPQDTKSLSLQMSLGSVCSLPTLEPARTESTLEISVPPKQESQASETPRTLPDVSKQRLEATSSHSAAISVPPSVTPITEASTEAEKNASYSVLTSGAAQATSTSVVPSTSTEATATEQSVSTETSLQSPVVQETEVNSKSSAASTEAASGNMVKATEVPVNSAATSTDTTSKSPSTPAEGTSTPPTSAEAETKTPEGTPITPSVKDPQELPSTSKASQVTATTSTDTAPTETALPLPSSQSIQSSTTPVSSAVPPVTASPSAGHAPEAVVKDETPGSARAGVKASPGVTPTGVTAAEGRGDGVSEVLTEASGRDSRASSSTFFSVRPSDDLVMVDTDSTDIPLPTTDSATADEGEDGGEETCACHLSDDGYQWVLQQPGETPDLAPAREDDQRNAWRAEVSLWRARLVVSLCRGRGLDRQDWATFHLLVHHPLTLDLKLSLLHASRLCAANSSTGAALVRVALIHLAQCGETLLQPESSRQAGWRAIKVDSTQPWAPVKGAVEILRSLGYRERDDNDVLKYPRRSGPEVSVLARLTLDLLVLAEELRLYLTGTHQYPTNISDLFFSATTPDPLQRPPSSAGSFVSAMSEASLGLRPESRASSVTDDDTETLQASVRQVKTHVKKAKQETSSEEEVTLKDDVENKVSLKEASVEITSEVKDSAEDEDVHPNHVPTPVSTETKELGSTASLPVPSSDKTSLNNTMSSLPDLQSQRLSTTSQKSGSGSNETVTPVPSPVARPSPVSQVNRDNPEEHIYEEIDVIRQQVQALRASSVPVETVPPPLPPKKKVSSGGDDDSGLSLTYPQVEWSSVSMPGSLRGGSTGARRKKRRAPMPPEFMPTDWKQTEAKSQESSETVNGTKSSTETEKRNEEYRKSLNPFYEEIDSVQEKVEELKKQPTPDYENKPNSKDTQGNPFVRENCKVVGYIGKNPFYEEVDLLKNSKEYKEASTSHPSLPTPSSDGSLCAMGSLAELQDEVQTAVRPKRRAPKPPPNPQPPSTPQLTQPSTPQPERPSESAPLPSTPEATKQTSSPTGDLTNSEAGPAGEVNQEVKVNDGKSAVDGATATPQSQEQSAGVKLTSQTSDKKTEGIQQKTELEEQTNTTSSNELAKEVKAEVPLQPARDKNKSVETSADKNALRKDSSAAPDTKPVDQVNKTKETTPKASRAAHQRTPLQHPTTPPPPPPTTGAAAVKASTTPSGTPPTEPPAKAPLSVLDDIPYMDANEIKYAKAQKTSQSPQMKILEPSGTSNTAVTPQLSPSTTRHRSLLLSGISIVPFIDDSDLPPDCPPPPPPGPPPESPPESPTPHNSPPETPHTSPPETPHNSPPETPRASRQSSPVTVAPLVATTTKDTASSSQGPDENTPVINGDDEAPPIPPKMSQLVVVTPPEEEEQQQTPAPSATKSEPLAPTETSQLPPALPPKTLSPATTTTTTPASATPVPSETSTSDTLEAPSGKHSIQSSMSEERYEIPDTSIPPPARPPPPPVQPAVPKQNSQTEPPHTGPSEEERYEVPEAPEGIVAAKKEVETEERYEIPEVVMETALRRGENGALCTMTIGRTTTSNTRQLESVFGPPKPAPRRRRSHPPAPPRPPKTLALTEGSRSLPKTGRPPSATSSFSTTSGNTTSSAPTPAHPPVAQVKANTKTRRSWPSLFCDCLYVNCRNYDDVDK